MENFDKKTRFISIALFFLAIGMMTSATIVGGYHIFILIPAFMVYLTKTYKVQVSKSSLILLLLFTWALVCGFYNLHQMENVRKSFDDLKFYILGFFLIIPLRYYYERTTVHQRKKILNVFLLTIIVAFFVGISKAWFNFNPVKMSFGDYPDRSGGFFHIMRYGYSNALIFVLLLAGFINRGKIQEYITPKLFYPALVLSFFAVFTAATRGALLGMFISIPFLLLKYRPKLAKAFFGFGGLAFAGMVAVSLYLGDKSPIRIINFKDQSSNIRVSQYLAGIKAMEENPIFGLGPVQFSHHVTDIKERNDIWAQDFVGHTHNTFIEHAASFGVPGLILFTLFLAFWFKEMIGLRSDFGWAIASYITGYVVSGQFELLFDSVNSHLMFFLYSWSQIFVQCQKEKSTISTP